MGIEVNVQDNAPFSLCFFHRISFTRRSPGRFSRIVSEIWPGGNRGTLTGSCARTGGTRLLLRPIISYLDFGTVRSAPGRSSHPLAFCLAPGRRPVAESAAHSPVLLPLSLLYG